MATILTFRAASTMHLSALGGSSKPAGLGSRQTAKRKAAANSRSFLSRKPVATLLLSDFDNFRDVPVLQGRHGMGEFVSQLREYYEASGEAVPGRIEIVNSAAVCGNQAHHINNPVHTQVLHTIYATPNFRGEKRFSFVAIEAGEQEWMCQVQLLFRTPEDSCEHVFVRYLKLDESRWDAAVGNEQEDPLFGSGCTPLVWESAGRGKWPYEVLLLSTVIRREFIFPDVRGVYALPPSSRRVKDAAKAVYDSSDEASSDEEEDESDAAGGGEEHGAGNARARGGHAEAATEKFIRASCLLYEQDGGERFWEAEAVGLDAA
jgi:hypothetical protein